MWDLFQLPAFFLKDDRLSEFDLVFNFGHYLDSPRRICDALPLSSRREGEGRQRTSG